MSLAQQNVVVLAYPRYQELDFWYPVLRGREEGATVHIVAAGPEGARASSATRSSRTPRPRTSTRPASG